MLTPNPAPPQRQLAGDLDRQKTVNRNRADIQQTEERNEFEAAQDAEKKYSAFLVRYPPSPLLLLSPPPLCLAKMHATSLGRS